ERQGGHGEGGAAPAVGERSGRVGGEGAPYAHGDERRGGRVETQVAAAAMGVQAGTQEETEPRPHRVELPHVTEVAEAGQPRPALAKDGACHVEIEAR